MSVSCHNSLKVDLSAILNYQCHIEISPWSEKGVNWEIDYGDERIESSYKSDLGLPLNTLFSLDDAELWRSSFSEVTLMKLIDYESQYQGSVYSALWFVSRSKAAKELFEDYPLLFWIALQSGLKKNWSYTRIESLFWMKRIKILEYCALPPAKTLLKFLGKMKHKRMTNQNWSLLLKFIEQKPYYVLNHLSVIDFELINFINDNPVMLNSQLVKHYQQSWDWREFIQLFNDTFRLGNRLEQGDILFKIGRCHSINALKIVHDQLIVTLNSLSLSKIKLKYYPKAIIRGNKNIVPIMNSKELFEEGQLMSHCIYSYHEEVLNGKYSIYKVLSPERATLCIKIMPNGNHLLDQMKLRFNQKSSVKTNELVVMWLNKQSIN